MFEVLKQPETKRQYTLYYICLRFPAFRESLSIDAPSPQRGSLRAKLRINFFLCNYIEQALSTWSCYLWGNHRLIWMHNEQMEGVAIIGTCHWQCLMCEPSTPLLGSNIIWCGRRGLKHRGIDSRVVGVGVGIETSQSDVPTFVFGMPIRLTVCQSVSVTFGRTRVSSIVGTCLWHV